MKFLARLLLSLPYNVETMRKNREKLRELLSGKLSKDEIIKISQVINPNQWEDIYSLVTEEDRELSANAAHILLNTRKGIRIWLGGKIHSIMENIQTVPFDKTKRLLLSILEKQKIETLNIDIKFLNYCLDNIISLETPPAIKVLCIKLAYKQCMAYPELLSELKNILEIMEDNMLCPSILCAKKHAMKAISTTLFSYHEQDKKQKKQKQ